LSDLIKVKKTAPLLRGLSPLLLAKGFLFCNPIQLFGYAAKFLATAGVFGLLYFGFNKLFPQVQSLSSIFQLLGLLLLFGVSGCLLLFFLKCLTGLDRNYHL
jgi:hypothetical protein